MRSDGSSIHDPLMGTRIDGRYTVHGLLGRGAQAVVYEGTHDELARPVAIKVLDISWAAEPRAVTRFLREARTASALSHSHIVDVSDLGRLSDGRPYLVMPRVPGTPLSELLTREGPQPPERVVRLLAGVASALDFIHARGFVHRDVKPENLMFVHKEDGSETVVLLDFGIAVLTGENAPRLTQQNALFGTPEYMPPEVWEGRLPDGTGDVYALAVVTFELLTGKLPFDHDNPLQLLAQKYRTPAPMLHAIGRGEFSPAIEAIVARGLATKPRDRFETAGSFIAQLKAAVEGRAIDIAQPPTAAKGSGPRTLAARYALLLRGARGSPLRNALGRHAHRSTQILRRTFRRPWRRGPQRTPTTVLRDRSDKRLPWLALVVLPLAVLLLSRIDSMAARLQERTEPDKEHKQQMQPPPRADAPTTSAEPTRKPRPIGKTESPQPERAKRELDEPTTDEPHVTKAIQPAGRARAVNEDARSSNPRPPGATTKFGQAKANQDASTQQRMALGTSALLKGHADIALVHFQALTAALPQYAPAWRGLGLAYERTRQDARALAAYRKYLSLATDNAQREAVQKRMRALAQ